jgi:LAO/AO transport system kinase
MNFRHAGIEMDAVLKGQKTAVAAALNFLESRRPADADLSAELVETLAHHARPARHVIGITGPPGAGKSTLISRLIREYRCAGRAVGVLTVDPSSPRSGGALLGDRARIDYDPGDAGLFIRSMAAGAHLGGLAWTTRHCLSLFEAVYDRIIVETTGVGQSETEIEKVVDSVVCVVQPGSGDSLQFMKAGIMEIAHVLVVNKADHRNLALKTYHELQSLAGVSSRREDGWTAEPILASALEGSGQQEIVAALERHLDFLSSGSLEDQRRMRRVQWVVHLFAERFGSYGVERLGGECRILARLERADLSNPFRALRELAQEVMGG